MAAPRSRRARGAFARRASVRAYRPMVRSRARLWPSAPALVLAAAPAFAQGRAPLPPLPAPLGIPAPGGGHRPAVRAAADRAGRHRRAAVSGRVAAAQGRSRPRGRDLQPEPGGAGPHLEHRQHPQPVSIEFHTVDRGINTGAVVILAAGGGHNTLNVGDRERRLRAVLLQLRRQHRHPAQPPAQGRLRRRRAMR